MLFKLNNVVGGKVFDELITHQRFFEIRVLIYVPSPNTK